MRMRENSLIDQEGIAVAVLVAVVSTFGPLSPGMMGVEPQSKDLNALTSLSQYEIVAARDPRPVSNDSCFHSNYYRTEHFPLN